MSVEETKSVGVLYREKLVRDLKSGLDENENVFLLSYSNISSLDVSSFRKELQKAGAQTHVSKNKIIQIALKEAGHEKLAERVSGQSAVVWTNEDSVSVAKILVKLSEDFENVLVKGGALSDKVLEEADVKRLSDLPSKEVLRAQLLGTIQAPITQLLGAFNAKSRDLLSILKQLSEQKGGS